MGRGKLIVIDGIDGSGKATQVELLYKSLVKDGFKVKKVDFPEYYNNFFGKFIGHCLSEQYYNFINVHPKIASVLYAADRWESSEDVRRWLGKGYIVLANRYVSANQIHQGGKIKNAKKREVFLKWLDEMEYEVFKIPKPDITFYLSLPVDITKSLIKDRNKRSVRAYTGNKKDVYEVDIQFQRNSQKSAIWLSGHLKNFVKIDCEKNGKIDTRENIHQKIYEKVKKVLK